MYPKSILKLSFMFVLQIKVVQLEFIRANVFVCVLVCIHSQAYAHAFSCWHTYEYVQAFVCVNEHMCACLYVSLWAQQPD